MNAVRDSGGEAATRGAGETKYILSERRDSLGRYKERALLMSMRTLLGRCVRQTRRGQRCLFMLSSLLKPFCNGHVFTT